jgi:hypothetical protein
VSPSRRILNSKKCKVVEQIKENLHLNFKTRLSQTVIQQNLCPSVLKGPQGRKDKCGTTQDMWESIGYCRNVRKFQKKK